MTMQRALTPSLHSVGIPFFKKSFPRILSFTRRVPDWSSKDNREDSRRRGGPLTENQAVPPARTAGIIGMPAVAGMIHGAFPAVLDAGVFREDQFPEFPGRPTVRGREVFEMKAHGFRRGKVIGQVESGGQPQQKENPYPQAEGGMEGISARARKASRQPMTGTLPLQSRSLTSPLTYRKGRSSPVASVQRKRGFRRKSRQQNSAYVRKEVPMSRKSPHPV